MSKHTTQRLRVKEEELRAAMASLIQNTNFHVFMDVTRDMRENAVSYMTHHDTVRTERDYLAAVGEVRCYDYLWDVYQAALQPVQVAAEDESAG